MPVRLALRCRQDGFSRDDDGRCIVVRVVDGVHDDLVRSQVKDVSCSGQRIDGKRRSRRADTLR
jgi:hypothetical protein